MKYIRKTLGEGFGSTNQIVIQTPKSTGASVLHGNALLLHLQAMRVATNVTVDMFEVYASALIVCHLCSNACVAGLGDSKTFVIRRVSQVSILITSIL